VTYFLSSSFIHLAGYLRKDAWGGCDGNYVLVDLIGRKGTGIFNTTGNACSFCIFGGVPTTYCKNTVFTATALTTDSYTTSDCTGTRTRIVYQQYVCYSADIIIGGVNGTIYYEYRGFGAAVSTKSFGIAFLALLACVLVILG